MEPARDLVCSQPEDATCRMVLAKTPAGDMAVAYLPGNDRIEIDVLAFPKPLRTRWFDPVKGLYEPMAGDVMNQGIRQFVPPREGDWVLQLTKALR